MNGTEKIKKMLENQSVDFVGACGWMHTPDVDRKSPEEFVQKVIRLTDENRWDFLKLMNNGSYLPEAYGEDIIFFSENIPLANQKAKRLAVFPNPLIKTENDLTSLPVLDAKSNPVLLRNAKVVQLLVEHYKGSIPVIPTLFTPSATILELCGGNEKLTEFINTCPEKVETAFEALLHSTCSVADLFIEAGADGFFIASKHTSPEMLAPEFFDRFCANFDKRLIAHIKDRTWFNILHVHGQKNMYIEQYVQYDVQAINWENIPHGLNGDGITSVADMRALTDKILIGGTDQFYDFYGTTDEVRERFRSRIEVAARESKDNRFIFAPGCSLPLDVPPENIHQLRIVADEYNATIGK